MTTNQFELSYRTDPTDWAGIRNMSFADAKELGLLNDSGRGRNEFLAGESDCLCYRLQKRLPQQAGIMYSKVYDKKCSSPTFLELTPKKQKQADDYRLRFESAVLKFKYAPKYTTYRDPTTGVFVRSYKLLDWRDREGRIGWRETKI
jgi:hypothetical protein